MLVGQRLTWSCALAAVALTAAACTGTLTETVRRSHGDGGGVAYDAGRRGAPPIDPSDDPDGSPPPVGPPPLDDSGSGSSVLDGGGPAPSCAYPSGATGRMAMGQVISPYSWRTAYREDGTRLAFDLTTFHCEPEWDRYTAVLFVVGAAWCSNCPDYERAVAALGLGALGTLVVFLESQNESYESATSEEARATIDRTVGSAPGLRIGEADNTMPDAIGSQTSTVPTGYFVRRSDMRILAADNELGTTPPWDEMAAAPEMDWVSRLRGGGGGSGAPCTEESLEPDDSRGAAAPIAPGTFSGGICGSDDDYFQVSLAGSWRVDLRTRYSDGDLDLFVLDASGAAVVTSDSADDDESVSYTGPATVRIVGYAGARAPYTLTLVSL